MLHGLESETAVRYDGIKHGPSGIRPSSSEVYKAAITLSRAEGFTLA